MSFRKKRDKPFSILRSSPVTIHLLVIFILVMKKLNMSLVALSKTAVLPTLIVRQHVNTENYREGKDSCPFDLCAALATSLKQYFGSQE